MSAQPGSVLLVLLLATSTPIASASKPSVDAARYGTSRPSVEAARSGTSRSSGKSGESGQSGGDAELTALRSGRYEEVIGGYRAALGSARGAEVTEAARRLVDALLLVGRYEEAERSAREYASGNPERAAQIANRLGEALSHVGRLAEAQAAFETSISAGAGDALRAELNLAELRFARGDHDEAMRDFDRFIAVYNAARSSRSGLSAEDLTAVGVACVYLGRENPDLFHDAVRAFDQAIAADPGDPEPRLRMAELFLDKYDSREAGSLLRDVLAANGLHPRALLARARQARFDGEGDALAWVDKALAVNERLVSGACAPGSVVAVERAVRSRREGGARRVGGQSELARGAVDTGCGSVPQPRHGSLREHGGESSVAQSSLRSAVRRARRYGCSKPLLRRGR